MTIFMQGGLSRGSMYHVHGRSSNSSVAGKPDALKGACPVWREAHGTGPSTKWYLAGCLPYGGIWRLTIRDERVTEGNKRYLQVPGGSNGLYLAQSLLLKRQAVVLTEGEFDALSLAQECGDLVAVVATGTTKGSHTPHWISLLAQQGRVLVAFDAERDKGDADAQWWIERLGNAQRLRPLWNDANQMLQDGVNVREWISAALAKKAAPMVLLHDEINKGQPAHLIQNVCTPTLSSFVKPQTHCPFEYAVVDRTGSIKAVPCQGKPLAYTSWCVAHQHAQTLLDLGARLGYPRIQLTRHRAIGAGRGSWEAYACRAPATWLRHDLPFIRSQSPNGECGMPVESEALPESRASHPPDQRNPPQATPFQRQW